MDRLTKRNGKESFSVWKRTIDESNKLYVIPTREGTQQMPAL